jgi:hypothetical protein
MRAFAPVSSPTPDTLFDDEEEKVHGHRSRPLRFVKLLYLLAFCWPLLLLSLCSSCTVHEKADWVARVFFGQESKRLPARGDGWWTVRGRMVLDKYGDEVIPQCRVITDLICAEDSLDPFARLREEEVVNHLLSLERDFHERAMGFC